MTRVARGAAPQHLNSEAIYISPLGRLCRWQPGESTDEVVHFVYATRSGQRAQGALADGFAMSMVNVTLLRRVA